jgi:hypothetical protein
VLVTEAPCHGVRRSRQRIRDADPRADRPQTIQRDLLSDAEIAWLDGYHTRVRGVLARCWMLKPAWLDAATRPLT